MGRIRDVEYDHEEYVLYKYVNMIIIGMLINFYSKATFKNAINVKHTKVHTFGIWAKVYLHFPHADSFSFALKKVKLSV